MECLLLTLFISFSYLNLVHSYGAASPDPNNEFDRCEFGRHLTKRCVGETMDPQLSVCPRGFFCFTPVDGEGPCCLRDNPCSTGVPYKKNNDAVTCSRRKRCPSGHVCTTGEKYAVCCPTATPDPNNEFDKCDFGRHLTRRCVGEALDPRLGVCPRGFFCFTPVDGDGPCCRRNNPCSTGVPYKVNDDAVTCSRRRRCPSGHVCTTGNNYAVCCPAATPDPNNESDKCDFGRHLSKRCVGETLDPQLSVCPRGFFCYTPDDGDGPCCRRNNPCSTGVPYRVNDDAVTCSRRRRCPSGHVCTTGNYYAVCCPDKRT